MDLATIIGLVGCMSIMIFGIVSGEQGMPALWNFYDPASIMITIGGSLFCMLTSASGMVGFLKSLKTITITTKMPILMDEAETIRKIIELSNIARKEGLLALEEAAETIEDEFLKKGILLIVDGTDPELVRNILETELACVEKRHSDARGFWMDMSAMGPAWGMIGTLIGLINMLKEMNDPSSIGGNMATALVTTFYGSVLANWLCIPVATKLKAKSAQEIMLKEVIVEGLLSIQAGENPRVIEEKLKSFMSPEKREKNAADEGGEEIGA